MDKDLNLISTTLSKWSEGAFDCVTDRNALLFAYKKIGKLNNMNGNKQLGSIVIAPGGKDITETVSISETKNSGWVDPDDELGTESETVLAEAVFQWKICYANAVAFEPQILANQDSKFRKTNMIKALIDNAESSLINNVGKGLYNLTSANAKSLNGLPEIITDDGTGTVGGISTTTHPLWKNQCVEVAKEHTPAQLEQAMGQLYRKCRNGTDIIVTTDALYGEYEAALKDRVKVATMKGLEDAWFDYLRFHKAVVIWDEHCPANRMYFLNTKALKLNFMKGAEITVKEKEHVPGTLKHIWPILAMCNWSVKSRRDLGVLVVAAS